MWKRSRVHRLQRRAFSWREMAHPRQTSKSTFLDRTVDSIRPAYRFDVSCQGSVPEAIIAFLDGTSFEDTLRLAISLGGDSDTQAAIAGSMIAQAFYGEIPSNLESLAREMLDQEILEIVDKFNSTLT